jgi:hypothetical protein
VARRPYLLRVAALHLVARGTGSLKWSIMRGRRPWSLVRAVLTHVFAVACTPSREQQCYACVSPRGAHGWLPTRAP